MNIESLINGKENNIIINKEIKIPKEIYQNTEILDLENIQVDGKITYPKTNNLILDINCKGVMVINDSVSLKPVKYNFSFDLSENVYEKLEKDQFTLDIISILWENIVLEIPIRYSEVKDYKEYKGDGWKIISEEEFAKKTNNPFKDLLEEIEKE